MAKRKNLPPTPIRIFLGGWVCVGWGGRGGGKLFPFRVDPFQKGGKSILVWNWICVSVLLFGSHIVPLEGIYGTLTFATLWTNSADDKLMNIEAICMKCQFLSPGKNKKNISKCRLLKTLLRVLSINRIYSQCAETQSELRWSGGAKCHVSYVTGASSWYWLTVGQGLLSL